MTFGGTSGGGTGGKGTLQHEQGIVKQQITAYSKNAI